jgi:Na+:H+ antiporter, NhaA family
MVALPRSPAKLTSRGNVKKALSDLFIEFYESERTGGLLLVLCTIISIAVSNSPLGSYCVALWRHTLDLSTTGIRLTLTTAQWINDGLMTVFFLLVGLELKRELYIGELSNPRTAYCPSWAL